MNDEEFFKRNKILKQHLFGLVYSPYTAMVFFFFLVKYINILFIVCYLYVHSYIIFVIYIYIYCPSRAVELIQSNLNAEILIQITHKIRYTKNEILLHRCSPMLYKFVNFFPDKVRYTAST